MPHSRFANESNARTQEHNLAKIWGRGFESLRPLQSTSPQTFSATCGARKSPTATGFRASGLGVRCRNVTPNCSPNGQLSPELESRPFYSTSFFAHAFSGLGSLWSRKVGIPFLNRNSKSIDPAPSRPTGRTEKHYSLGPASQHINDRKLRLAAGALPQIDCKPYIPRPE
jgi:hypothetical protein